MRNLFKSRSRKNSISSANEDHVIHNKVTFPRRSSDVTYEVLHSSSARRGTDPGIFSRDDSFDLSSNPIYDEESEYTPSIALSDTDTLNNEPSYRMELQDSYNDNFTSYLPYIMQQVRLEQQRTLEERATLEADRGGRRVEEMPMFEPDDMDDDLPTMIDQSITVDANVAHNLIMGKQTSKFNTRRDMVTVNELFKSTQYVFISEESFNLFKHLRTADLKKSRKNLVIVYDSKGTIAKLDNIHRQDIDDTILDGNRIDKRSHIIPVDYKIKGLGLPLFRIQVPYLSTFRKSTPLIVFKRYREIPLKPSDEETHDPEEFESYTFCYVHSKHFQKVRRFILTFNPDSNPFKVIVFMNNFRPFSDFVYKNTRFRILGSPIIMGNMNVNVPLRLTILDEDKPSLCDDMINKKSSHIVNVIKKKGSSTQIPHELDYDPDDYTTFPNPYPNPNCPIMKEDSYPHTHAREQYVSKTLPPFGNLKANDNFDPRFIPKKYSELSKLQIYQDTQTAEGNLDSTLSIDLDTLVLATVMSTLREVVVRTAYKTPQTSSVLLGYPVRLSNPIGGVIIGGML